MINNKLFRGFTFDGVNSLDYDIYITGESVYNAPERAVEKVSVPGRNGDLTIDQGRFENIEVTYAQCGCAATTQAELAEKVAAFRNALCSRVGYKRLTDDYNKDEYRMAMYASGLEVEAVAQHRMGTFDIVFDAMPQRFLLSGEVPKVMAHGMNPSSTKTESGSVVSIESDGADKVTSLVAQIEPVQAGSGDPSPTNVRAITGWTGCNANVNGRNFLECNITEAYTAYSGITITPRGDGALVLNGTTSSTSIPIVNFAISPTGGTISTASDNKRHLPVGTYKVNTGDNRIRLQVLGANDGGTQQVLFVGYAGTFTITDKYKHNWVRLNALAGTYDNVVFHPFIALESETDTTYEPYKGETYPVSFGSAGTVYGGMVDVVTGVLTVNRLHAKWGEGVLANTTPSNITTLGNLTRFWLYVHSVKVFEALSVKCDRLKSIGISGEYGDSTTTGIGSGAAASASSCWIKLPTADVGTTASSIKAWLDANPIEITYPITPQTYNLTALEVDLLVGNSHVWASTGDITLTYGADPYKVINPTLFESKPLLMVTGRGTLSVGDVTITITGTASQVLYIDCDIMEVYSITDGQMQPQNSLVTMNSYDFPKLKPGANKITLGVGITQVVVTPRWWRV